MLENYLLNIGMRCGTVKNFNNVIIDDMRKKDGQHWYFLTPVKIIGRASNLNEATVQIAYPFLATNSDLTEEDAIKRLTPVLPEFKNSLENELKKMLLLQSATYSLIPFWANEKGDRTERKDFGQTRIHILNAQVTVRYRDSWFTCNCN